MKYFFTRALLFLLMSVCLPVQSFAALGSANLNIISAPTVTSSTTNSVSLYWFPVKSDYNNWNYVPNYKVYFSTQGIANNIGMSTIVTNTNSATVTGLQSDTMYYFSVTALDYDGKESPSYSPVASALTERVNTSQPSVTTVSLPKPMPITLTSRYGIYFDTYGQDWSKVESISLLFTQKNEYLSTNTFQDKLSNNQGYSCTIPVANIRWGAKEILTPEELFDYQQDQCQIYAVAFSPDKSSLELFFKDHNTIYGKTVASTVMWNNGNSSTYSNLLHVGKDSPKPLNLKLRNSTLFFNTPITTPKEYYLAFSREKRNMTQSEINFESNNTRLKGDIIQFCFFTMKKGQKSVIDKNFSECNFSLDWSDPSGVLLSFNKWDPEGRSVIVGYVDSQSQWSPFSNAIYFKPTSSTTVTQGNTQVSFFKDSTSISSKYTTAVKYVYEHNIMQGFSGSFRPKSTINRAEIVKTLVEAFLKEGFQGYVNYNGAGRLNCFTDVKATEWYGDYVCYAYHYGNMAKGYPDGSFRPNNSVTKAEGLKLLLYATANTPEISGFGPTPWYLPYQEKGGELGLFSTVSFVPEAPLTREEMAEWIYLISKK